MGGADDSPRYAAIDVGSHTIRLLIARLDESHRLVPLQNERRITRLARQFQSDYRLKEPAIQASLQVLGEYAAIIGSHGVASIACGATGVVRKACNGPELLERMRYGTGIEGSILSESSEAFLSAKGVMSALPESGKGLLTFDLGGSTTEFLFVEHQSEEPAWSASVFAGASTITERFLTDNPQGRRSLVRARIAIQDTIREIVNRFSPGSAALEEGAEAWELVGTAGTVSTLAAMNLRMVRYEPFRVNGAVLTEDWLSRIIDRLSKMSLSERRRLPGLEEGREDVILGGALIVHEILLGLGRSRLVVTDAGLLEGLLLELVERQHFGPVGLRSPLVWRSSISAGSSFVD